MDCRNAQRSSHTHVTTLYDTVASATRLHVTEEKTELRIKCGQVGTLSYLSIRIPSVGIHGKKRPKMMAYAASML